MYKFFPYDKIAKWEYIVWLIHWKNSHWAIYLANSNLQQSTLLDPSDSIPPSEITRIKDAMNRIVESADPINQPDNFRLTDIPCTDVPKQTSGSVCGIFVCQYINDFFENPANIDFKMPQIQNCKNLISEWVNESLQQNEYKKTETNIDNILIQLQLHQITLTELFTLFSNIHNENMPKQIQRPSNNFKQITPLSKCSYQLQHLFRINPKKAIDDLNKEALEIEPLPVETMNNYFIQHTNNATTSNLPRLKLLVENFTYEYITKDDIIQAIRSSGDKSPGQDGIPSKQWIKWMENDALTIIYKFIMNTLKMPKQWQQFQTKLIIKPGKQDKVHLPESWRPIASMPTSYRIFSKIINDRIMR